MMIQTLRHERWFLAASLLIDGTGSDPVVDPVIVVQDGRIAAILPQEQLVLTNEAFTLQLPGATILPGLIDCHFHATGDPLFHVQDWAHKSREALLSQANHALKETLKTGVTTVRDCGSPKRVMAEATTAIQERITPGPHIVSCNQVIAPRRSRESGLGIDKSKSYRKAVEMAVDGGADFIKVLLHGPDIFTGYTQSSRIDLDELTTLVSAAHTLGCPVAVQAVSCQAIELALTCGVDVIEVGLASSGKTVLPWETLAAGHAHETVSIVPTIDLITRLQESKGQPLVRLDTETAEIHCRNVAAMVQQGFRVGAGSNRRDEQPESYSLVPELARLALSTGSTIKAIGSATGVAARIAGIEKACGTVTPGKRADLLVVKGNPLEHIQDLEQVLLVIKEGFIAENCLAKEKEV